jgi:hypothetical protein
MKHWTISKAAWFVGAGVLAISVAILLSFRWYSWRITEQPLYPKSQHLEQQDNWQPFGGAWEMVDGAMRNNSDERGAKTMNGSTGLKDYLVEADVHQGALYPAPCSRAPKTTGAPVPGYCAGLRDLDNPLSPGARLWLVEYQARGSRLVFMCTTVVSPKVAGLWM